MKKNNYLPVVGSLETDPVTGMPVLMIGAARITFASGACEIHRIAGTVAYSSDFIDEVAEIIGIIEKK